MKSEIKILIRLSKDAKVYNYQHPPEGIFRKIKLILEIRGDSGFTGQSCSMLLTAMYKFKIKWADLRDDILNGLCDAIINRSDNFNFQEIANTLYALSNMGARWEQINQINGLHGSLVTSIIKNTEHFNSQGIANTLYALSNMGAGWEQINGLHGSLVTSIIKNTEHFNCQDTANTLRGLSNMGLGWEQIKQINGLHGSLFESMIKNTKHFNSQGIASTLNALSKMGAGWEQINGLHDSLFESIIKNTEHFNAQEIVNTLNALSKMGLGWEQIKQINGLHGSLVTSIIKNTGHFNCQDTANTLRGLSNMGLGWEQIKQINGLHGSLVKSITKNTRHYNPQDTVNTLNALSKMGARWEQINGLHDSLFESIIKNTEHFNSQDTANTLNALSKMGAGWAQINQINGLHGSLFESMIKNTKHFNCQDTVNTLNALSKMGAGWKQINGLHDSLFESIIKNTEHFNSQGIANTLHALSKMGARWEQIKQINGLHGSLLDAIKLNANKFNKLDRAQVLYGLRKMGFVWQELTHAQDNLNTGSSTSLINADIFISDNNSSSLALTEELDISESEKNYQFIANQNLLSLVRFGIDDKYIDGAIEDYYINGGKSKKLPTYNDKYDFVAIDSLSHNLDKYNNVFHETYNINNEQVFKYTYYSSLNSKPDCSNQVVFVYCGRKLQARIPVVNANSNARLVLVLTAAEYAEINAKLPSFADVLVVEKMQLAGHGDYSEVIGTINARRLASLLFASHNNLEHCMCLDDNIAEIRFNLENDSSAQEFDDVYNLFVRQQKELSNTQGKNVLLGAATISGIMLENYNNCTCHKIWFLDLKSIFTQVKAADLRSLLFKAIDSKVWGEDIFFQLMLAQLFPQNKMPFECFNPTLLGFVRSKAVTNACQKNIKSIRDIIADNNLLAYNNVVDLYTEKNLIAYCIDAATKIKDVVMKKIDSYDERYGQANLDTLLSQHYSANLSGIIDNSKNIKELRTHQVNALKEINLCLCSKEEKDRITKGVVVLATGAGKTLTQAQLAINALTENDKPGVVIISCPTVDLVEQFYTEFAQMLSYSDLFNKDTFDSKRLIKVSSGVNAIGAPNILKVFNGVEQIESSIIAIVCIDSLRCLIKQRAKFVSHSILISLDECHHSSYSEEFYTELGTFLDSNKMSTRVYGFTATPRDEEAFFKRDKNPKGLIYNFDLYSALLSGVVCPIKTSLLPIDYNSQNLKENISNILQKVFSMAHPNGKVKNSKTIIYLPNVKDYYEVVEHIINYKLKIANKIFKIHSGEGADDVKNFASYNAPCIALACGMLRLGYSDNQVGTVIYLRNINGQDSVRDLEQAAGRALRLNPQDKNKAALLITWHLPDGLREKLIHLDNLDYYRTEECQKLLNDNKKEYMVKKIAFKSYLKDYVMKGRANKSVSSVSAEPSGLHMMHQYKNCKKRQLEESGPCDENNTSASQQTQPKKHKRDQLCRKFWRGSKQANTFTI